MHRTSAAPHTDAMCGMRRGHWCAHKSSRAGAWGVWCRVRIVARPRRPPHSPSPSPPPADALVSPRSCADGTARPPTAVRDCQRPMGCSQARRAWRRRIYAPHSQPRTRCVRARPTGVVRCMPPALVAGAAAAPVDAAVESLQQRVAAALAEVERLAAAAAATGFDEDTYDGRWRIGGV